MASPLLPTMSRGHNALRDALPDLLCAIVTLLFGYAMGVVFGLNEDLIESRLAASADAVSATVYHGDSAAANAILSKSWTYMQRAHLHAGEIGAAAIGVTLLTPSAIRCSGCGQAFAHPPLVARMPTRSRWRGSPSRRAERSLLPLRLDA